MKQRTVGAIIFVIAIAGALAMRAMNTLYFDMFVILLACMGAIEMVRAMRDYLSQANYLIITVFIFLILPCYYYLGGITGVYKLFFMYFWATAVASIFNRGYGLQNMSAATLIGVYPIMMFALMIEINHWADYGTAALLLIFFTGPICDVFAYLVGSTLKGPKLFPTVSPKKTVSGAIGGIVGGIIGSILVYLASKYVINLNLGENTSVWFFIVYGFVCSILTEFGDLVESAVKRSLNIKDMGNVLPGHGGIMDRFDGVLFVVFATYIYFDVLLQFV